MGCASDGDCDGVDGKCETLIQPCPICNRATRACDGGPRDGLPCEPGAVESGVQITDGNTTTVNVALVPQPKVHVTGTVTDGSGHGWPLYTRIDVAVGFCHPGSRGARFPP